MQIFGPEELLQRIHGQDLCTACGACVDLCPYFKTHNGKISPIFSCDRSQGRCYAHCPKIDVDFNMLSETIHGKPYKESPLGEFRKICISKRGAKAPEGNFQNGGTVSALTVFALQQGLIDGAVLTDRTGIIPYPRLVDSPREVLECATSKYMAAPTIARVNSAGKQGYKHLGVVGTPCQLTALAQLRCNPLEREDFTDITTVTLGLFCTWAIDTSAFTEFLKNKGIDIDTIRAMDIPPPPAETFILTLENSVVEFPLNEIRNLVPKGCTICPDMTSEWADLSIGALEGNNSWNTLIIRTEKGEALVNDAVNLGFLELGELPQESLENLTHAAANKKNRAGETSDALGLNGEEFQRPVKKNQKQTITGFR